MTARHNAYMTDEDWSAAERLAVLLTIEAGKPVSVSEAIRVAVRESVASRDTTQLREGSA